MLIALLLAATVSAQVSFRAPVAPIFPGLPAAPEPVALKVPAGLEFVDLKAIDPADTGRYLSKAEGQRALSRELEKLQRLKDRLVGQKKKGLLVVAYGIDASGKDGFVKHVIGPLNPLGLELHSYKAPTEEEVRHGHLWRHQVDGPSKGRFTVFNRSHHENYSVPRALRWAKKKDLALQAEQMNDWERYLVENDIAVVKLFFVISKGEQLERLRERVTDPEKAYKFDPNDLVTRGKWKRFHKAYGEMLGLTSTEHAPWFVIPADKKWYRNLAAAKILRAALEKMDLRPDPPKDLPKPESLR